MWGAGVGDFHHIYYLLPIFPPKYPIVLWGINSSFSICSLQVWEGWTPPSAPRESPDWFNLNSMAHPLVSQFRDGHVASCGPMRVSPRARQAGLVFSWRGHGWWCEVWSSCSPFAITKEKPRAARDPVIPENEFRTTGGRENLGPWSYSSSQSSPIESQGHLGPFS